MSSLGCKGKNIAGRRCHAAPLASGYCWFHDPDGEGRRAVARSNGGRKRAYMAAVPANVQTIEDIRAGLCQVVGTLQSTDGTPQTCRLLIHAYTALRETLEISNLEKRLTAIEERLRTQ